MLVLTDAGCTLTPDERKNLKDKETTSNQSYMNRCDQLLSNCTPKDNRRETLDTFHSSPNLPDNSIF